MKKTKKQLDDELFIAALLKTMRMTGYLLPETEDEVEAFEALYGKEQHELPEKLKDLSFIFKGKE